MKSTSQTPSRTLSRRVMFVATTVLAVAVAWQIALAQQAPPTGGDAQAGEDSLKVGTYSMERAIQSYYRTNQFRAELQQIQQEVQGDPQKTAEAQATLQQKQQALLQAFQEDVQGVMPEIAEATDVKLVVGEIVYRDPSIQVEDLTPAVVEKINEGQDAAAAPTAVPGQQQAPGQQGAQPAPTQP